jgi:hypothetical protein
MTWFGLVSTNHGFGLLVSWFQTKPRTSLSESIQGIEKHLVPDFRLTIIGILDPICDQKIGLGNVSHLPIYHM